MRKFIRKLIGYLGYDFIKVTPTPIKKEKTIQVGKFKLIFPKFNPLIQTYSAQPSFASEISRLTLAVLKKYPGLIFLDVGANAGDTVARVKSIADIPIICIEGDDVSYSYLERNVRQFNQVKTIKQFLGEKDGQIKADLDKKGWNTTIIPSETSNQNIQIMALDNVLKNQGLLNENLKLFKVDTEGFDTIIIRGSRNYIRTVRPVIYLEYNWDNMNAIGENGYDTIVGLREEGYNKILFFDDRGKYILTTGLDNTGLLKSLSDYADGKTGLIYYYNLCLVHQEDDDLAESIVQGELLQNRNNQKY
jgi:FkbM family methyltransferase